MAIFGNSGRVFSCTVTDDPTSCSALAIPLHLKRLGYFISFANLGGVPSTKFTAMNDIAWFVVTAQSTGQDPLHTSSSSHSMDKKVVPKLRSFSGMDEDWFEFANCVMDDLGKSGLSRYLLDESFCSDDLEVAEAIFFGLRKALRGGTALHLASELCEAKDFSPCKLWQGLLQFYDARLNHANTVLCEIKRLVGLRLDVDTDSTEFISSWNTSLSRLSADKAKLASDSETLRELLLVATQDETCDSVRDDVVKDPAIQSSKILSLLRDKDVGLKIKDGADRAIAGCVSVFCPLLRCFVFLLSCVWGGGVVSLGQLEP